MFYSYARGFSAWRSLRRFRTDFRATNLWNHVESPVSLSPELRSPFRIVGNYAPSFASLAESGKSCSSFCTLSSQDDLSDNVAAKNKAKKVDINKESKPIDFTKIDINLLPTVLIVGRPNVGKSALFNRLIRRREALVYNTPTDHVTRDIREGVAKLSNLRFRVLDSAGLEAEASKNSVLGRTTEMTRNVLGKCQFALLLMDAREGIHHEDINVGKWMRKNAAGIKTIIVMNKSELLNDYDGSIEIAIAEANMLGFGNPIALSAETGLGMTELYEALKPMLETHMLQVLNDHEDEEETSHIPEEDELSKLPLQLAIVGKPNVGKSTLLNKILGEERVLVGPEAGLTRDSIRVHFEYEGRAVYLVDTAGWLPRTKDEKGPSSLSIVQSRKNLMRAHVVALVLDAEEIAKARKSMKHAEVVIARRAIEEGRGLIVIVNKMDLLKGKQRDLVMKAVPEEVQTVIPQVTGIPVVFIAAAMEGGTGQIDVMNQVIETYERWCSRLSTAHLNRWLRKVMSRHSWKDQSAQPKVKYFTQVKARPPTFVAFLGGKLKLADTDMRFLTNSLKEDFELGGIPIRIMQRSVERNAGARGGGKNSKSKAGKVERVTSDKRTLITSKTETETEI
ncbi:GTPase Der [Impatiens glandulifera]|uniref:GTPase Der n=1 Tax=Impatiens glandulifera TaxID=253017 RepID=UPI001FB05CE3|nr:GTPase Der [Impatiens glandulifera]